MARAAARAADLHAAGVAASADMRPVVAARKLRSALRQLSDAGESADGPLRGRILVSLALAESEQGHVAEGLRLLSEAEPFLPSEHRGVLYGQRGMLLRRTGRDELAMEQYAAALSVLNDRHEPVEVARVLLNRGVLHMAAAQPMLARSDLHRCSALATRHGLDGLAAKADHNLAYLDGLAGDIPAALHRYTAVARRYDTLFPGMLPVLALDRARALLAAGLFAEADRELASALRGLRQQRLSQDHAEAHLARAEAALLAGEPSAARRWATRAHLLFIQRDNPRWVARAGLVLLRADLATGTRAPDVVADRAQVLAETMQQLGLIEDARVAALLAGRAWVAGHQVARAASTVTACTPRRGDRLDTRLLWRLANAEIAAATGRTRVSARHLTAGLAELQRYRRQLGNFDLQTGAAVHGRDLAQSGLAAALASGSASEIFRWAERARAQALLMPAARPPEDPAAAAALAELRHIRTAMQAAELAGRSTRVLRIRSESLQRTIREHAWSATGSGTPGRPVSLAHARTELADATMVIYLPDGRRLRALVVAGGHASVLPLGRIADAEEALLRLRADLDASAGRAMPARLAKAVDAAIRRDAAALAGSILDPLLSLIGDRDLVVVPTGMLVTVPWAVLPGCRQRPVTVAPSASSWHTARRTMGRIDASARTLIVAGPGNDRGETEVAAIAAARPGAAVLIGPHATPAATLAAMSDANLVHIAAHGHHQPDNALFSELRLAGGPLMGYDLRQLAAPPAMIVLSSCEVGLHDVRPGDEALGMATAMLSAGSSTVIASVCRVADESAMTVMVRYHEALLEGRQPAAALAAAGEPGLDTGFICFGAG